MGQDALGSGRKELVQLLLRKRMINGDGGVKGAQQPHAGTQCDPGATLDFLAVPWPGTMWDSQGMMTAGFPSPLFSQK